MIAYFGEAGEVLVGLKPTDNMEINGNLSKTVQQIDNPPTNCMTYVAFAGVTLQLNAAVSAVVSVIAQRSTAVSVRALQIRASGKRRVAVSARPAVRTTHAERSIVLRCYAASTHQHRASMVPLLR